MTEVIRAAFSLAIVDGGFVIGIQIITFLLKYFGSNIQITPSDVGAANVAVSRTTFLVAIISILNLSVIIYRITGLTRGVKYSPFTCYYHALRRWPTLIMLYFGVSMLLLLTLAPIMNFLSAFNAPIIYRFFMLSASFLMPIGLLSCIFVVDQQKNPIQSLVATFDLVRNHLSFKAIFNIAMFYAMPLILSGYFVNSNIAAYLDLFNSIWFLFCHCLLIVLYESSNMIKNQGNNGTKKPSKVLVV